MSKLYFILHNVRSAYNIGAIFRTADGIGVAKIYLTGYTCAPHDGTCAWTTKPQRMIGKVALGADQAVSWEKCAIEDAIVRLRNDNVRIVALEQTVRSIDVKNFDSDERSIALILGNEPKGIDEQTLSYADDAVEIPMRGTKKSLNVAVAAGVAGYTLYDKLKGDKYN